MPPTAEMLDEMEGPVVPALPGGSGSGAVLPAGALGDAGWPKVDCSHAICSGVNRLAMTSRAARWTEV